MNSFLTKNKLWLSLLGIAVVIVALAFVFSPKSPEYKTSAFDTLKLINDQSALVAIQDVAGRQLIDIRSAELFAQGHPENAVNIPARQLLDKNSVEFFDQLSVNGKEAVIYSSEELQATAPWLLLQQLGYSNVKLLKGGISGTGEFKVPELAATEVSVIDTAAIRVKPEAKKATEINPSKKKPETVIPVKKAASSGGGC